MRASGLHAGEQATANSEQRTANNEHSETASGVRREDRESPERKRDPIQGMYAEVWEGRGGTQRGIGKRMGAGGAVFAILWPMAKRSVKTVRAAKAVDEQPAAKPGRPSALLDTRVIYCGDNLEQLAKLPDKCVDLIYIDPPFNSNRNYEVFWGECPPTKEKRSGGFDDRHASTQAYIDSMRPRGGCQQLARVLKPTGSFYYHCDGHASHTYSGCERGKRN